MNPATLTAGGSDMHNHRLLCCAAVASVLFALGGTSATLFGSGIEGDAQKLQEIHQGWTSNNASIVTWKGKALSVDQNSGGAMGTTSATLLDFSFSSNGNQLKVSASTDHASSGGRIDKYERLRTKDSYIVSGPYNDSDPTEFARHSRVISIGPLSDESNGAFSPDFDPLLYMNTFYGRDAMEMVKMLYDNRNSSNTDGVSVTVDGSLVTIAIPSGDSSFQYVFDLSKSGAPVEYRSASWPTGSGDHQISTYQMVDGIWLPLKTTIETRKSSGRSRVRDINWSEHHVNMPIPSDVFSLASIDKSSGNLIVDKRTHSQSMYKQEEFVRKYKDRVAVARDSRVDNVGAPPSTTWSFARMLLILANILVVAVLFVLWIFRRRLAR